MNNLFSIFMIGITALVALETVVYWHRTSKGNWREWPAGRSLMGLLGIIAIAFGFGVFNQLNGPYPARQWITIALYGLFIGALVLIRLTIRKEMRIGRALLQDDDLTSAGPVTVTLTGPVTVNVTDTTDTTEEHPDDRTN